MSTPPWASRTIRVSLSTAAASESSPSTDSVRTWNWPRAATVARVWSFVRAWTMTFAPSRANPIAICCPMPLDEPVTRHHFPANRPMGSDLRNAVGIGDESRGPAVRAPRRDVHRPLAPVEVRERPHLPGRQVLLTDHDALIPRVVCGRHGGRIGDIQHPLPVGRNVGKPVVVLVVAHLLLPAPVRLHPPYLHPARARRVEIDERTVRAVLGAVVEARVGRQPGFLSALRPDCPDVVVALALGAVHQPCAVGRPSMPVGRSLIGDLHRLPALDAH